MKSKKIEGKKRPKKRENGRPRQCSDRFSVITFSILHINSTLRNFISAELFIFRFCLCLLATRLGEQREKVSKQFPSIIEAHEFGNKSSFFLLSLFQQFRMERKENGRRKKIEK
jgi:hypothetical protein